MSEVMEIKRTGSEDILVLTDCKTPEEAQTKIKEFMDKNFHIDNVGKCGYDLTFATNDIWKKELEDLVKSGVKIKCYILNAKTREMFKPAFLYDLFGVNNFTIDNHIPDNIVYINHKF